MQYTTNYNLKKPDGTDNFDIANENGNMDTIDAQMKTNANAAAAAQSTANAAIPSTQKGAANGVATLGADGKVASAQLPAQSTDAQTLQTHPASDFVLVSAKGASNGVASLDGTGNVPASQLGNVPPVNAATTAALGTVQVASQPNSGNPVAASRSASVSEMQITSTSATNVATHTPTSQKNYIVMASVRVVTAATNVTITITWTDSTGAQTDYRINNQSLSVGTHDIPIKFLISVANQPITVTVTVGTANQVYASAAIVGV